MRRVIQMVIIVLAVCFAAVTEAKTVRATEMTSAMWAKLTGGGAGSEIIIEFRQGDQLPVSLSAKGDLLETSQAGVAYLGVKRNFLLKLLKNDVYISLDGSTFKPIQEVVGGTLMAGAGADESGGIANTINVVLDAHLK